MKSRFVLFFSAVLAIHLAVNGYIALRGWQALEQYPFARPYFLSVFVLITFSYLIGEVLEAKRHSFLSDILVWTGAFWFAFMLYFLLALVALDFLRLTQHFTHLLPAESAASYVRIKFIGAIGLVGATSILIAIGYYLASRPRIKRLEISIEKPSVRNSIHIVAMSDQHLGTILGRSRMQAMVEKVNSLEPDLILLVGDQVDGRPEPVIRKNLGEYFRKFQAPLGVFAITGNHEYIGNVEKSCAYLEEHGVVMLRDTVTEVAGIQIVGREDRSMRQFSGQVRRSLMELMAAVDSSKPIILLDHQPFHLEEAEEAGVDLQLSGHTHHAQIWPLNYITQRVYELSWGYKQRGKTHYYVSCGVGTWGPPVRIGSYSEIVSIELKFSG